GVLRASRVREQADHALGAELGEDREIGQLAVDRRVVELEVASVDDDPGGRPEGDPHRVRDRMTDPECRDPERSDLELVARFERVHRVVVELVLLDLVAEEPASQGRGIDRDAGELGQDVRQTADMKIVRSDGGGDSSSGPVVNGALEGAPAMTPIGSSAGTESGRGSGERATARRARASSRTRGTAPMSSKLSRSIAGARSAAAGWYM